MFQPTHTDNEDELTGETSLKNRSFVFLNILKAVVNNTAIYGYLSWEIDYIR